MKLTARLVTLVTAALLAIGAADGPANRDWNATVVETEAGHRIGNPDAALKLTEFISYTCPACAEFAREGDPALKLGLVRQGRVSLEIRHLLRDPVDLTVALLAHCGPAAKFPQNHAALMLSQDRWLPVIQRSTPAQRQRWSTGDHAGRHRAMASDAGLYAIMEQRGYGRAELDRCLADKATAERLAEASAADWKRPGIAGTPAFAIDGQVLAGTHRWRQLAPQLAARQ